MIQPITLSLCIFLGIIIVCIGLLVLPVEIVVEEESSRSLEDLEF